MKRTNRSGFTLLELLIVVVILGILASVAMPQFARTAKRARAAEAIQMVGAYLTAEWVYYQDQDKFTGVKTELMVEEAPEGADEHFNYAIAANASVDVTVTGTAENPGKASGITVTGVLKNDGTRTIVTSGP